MRVGALELDGPFLQAPMARYTSRPARILARRFGASLAFTEMLAAPAILEGKDRETGRPPLPEEHPIAAQIAAANAAAAAECARRLAALGFDLVEINLACPAPKIVRRGMGAALLRDPSAAARVVEAVARAVTVPVTAKIRRGFSPESGDASRELLRLLAEAGAAAATLHPRWAVQQFRGRADRACLAEAACASPLPLWGSGDLRTAADGVAALAECDVAAVTFARGAVGNPWIYAEANALFEGRIFDPPAPDEVRKIVREHVCLAQAHLREGAARESTRRALARYARRLPGGKRMLRALSGVRGGEAFWRFLAERGLV